MWINRDKKTKTVGKRTDMENKKLTKLEKYWIMYDVGNSAFVMLIATIIPIYFNYLAKSAGISEVNYLAYWGYAASVSTVIVAAIGPVLGYAELQKAIIYHQHDGRSDRLCGNVISNIMGDISCCICDRKSWLQCQPDLL